MQVQMTGFDQWGYCRVLGLTFERGWCDFGRVNAFGSTPDDAPSRDRAISLVASAAHILGSAQNAKVQLWQNTPKGLTELQSGRPYIPAPFDENGWGPGSANIYGEESGGVLSTPLEEVEAQLGQPTIRFELDAHTRLIGHETQCNMLGSAARRAMASL